MRRAAITLVVALFAGPAFGERFLGFLGVPRSSSEAATAPAMRLDQYIAALERIEARLAANDVAEARREARELSGRDVTGGEIRFHADQPLLDAIASSDRPDPRLRSRLGVTIAELRRAADLPASAPDPALLLEVAAGQHVPELVPGGEIDTTIDPGGPLFDRIVAGVGAAIRWIGRQIETLVDWIIDLLPRRRDGEAGATAGMRAIVLALVTLIVIAIAILAIEVLRRARGGAAAAGVAVSEPIGSRRDEDPLSRGASEWERYAGQLAAAGRFREAIRAWYHAVLVTCYSAGALHFRKGRTNWEYVSSLGPAVPWRREMIELTRRFEQEWYGADASTADALDDCSTRARAVLDALRRKGAA